MAFDRTIRKQFVVRSLVPACVQVSVPVAVVVIRDIVGAKQAE